MSNVNNPDDNFIKSENPFYPYTNCKDVQKEVKNPLYFRNISNRDDTLGKTIDKEEPMYAIEIVPPGCSNKITDKFSNKMKGRTDYLFPSAGSIYKGIFNNLKEKKNLVFVGISFWQEDQWELAEYIKCFIENNCNGFVYILVCTDKDEATVKNFLNQNNIPLKKIEFFNGSFSDNYKQIVDVL